MPDQLSVEGIRMELALLLAEAQAEMPNPKKSREGQKGYQRYKYATLDAVLDIVKPPLNKRGIFLAQPCSRLDDATMQVATTVFYKGQSMALDTKPYEYDSDPQEFGKRETYARRYSLLTAFGLAGEDDTDGDTGPKPPANPTGHPLGATRRKPDARKPDTRKPDPKRYLTRCLQLKAQCMQQGVREEGLDKWYGASFGEVEPSSLDIRQLTEWGSYLSQIAKDSDHGKEASNVD